MSANPFVGKWTYRSLLNDPDIRFTTSPENVMKYANFMADVGSIKERPAKWQDMFFPDIHGVKGD